MKVTCQTCGQLLPKTILTCPNCGGKTFLAQNGQVVNQTQPMQYNLPPNQQLSAQTPPVSSVAPSMHETLIPQNSPTPQPSQTTPYQGYVPPVAPPLPVQHPPNPSNPYTPVTPPETAIRPIEPALPPVYRKPLKPAYQMQYSGFIRRSFALAFDMVLLGIMVSLAWQQLRPLFKVNFNLVVNELSLGIASAVVYLLYVAFFTSRSRQATIGKMLVGLWVYDMNGQRIGFWHGFIREIIKLLLLPFAFLMWFTARKQTLHDIIARTVVLYDPS